MTKTTNKQVDPKENGNGGTHGNPGHEDPGHGQGNGGGQNNTITVQVRFQEIVVDVRTNVNESITALLQHAIKATGNNLADKDRFQLKLDGIVLNTNKKVSDYDIKECTLLVLILKAGGGGSFR